MRTFARRQIGGVEIVFMDCTQHAFAKHTHDEFVIGVNTCGRKWIWLDRKVSEADERDVTIYNPGEIQASHGFCQPWSLFSIAFEPRVLEDVFGLRPEGMFERTVHTQAGYADLLKTVCGFALRSDISDGEAAEALAIALGPLVNAVETGRAGAGRAITPAIRRTAERLRDCPGPLPCLTVLGRLEGMTPVQLVRAFDKAYGMPPYAWLFNERLKDARRMLASPMPLSDIAGALGFADQAHLTRRFKAAYGVAPGVWRRG
jgi:AraC family chemosensory pili system transcriptional regulator ChpD